MAHSLRCSLAASAPKTNHPICFYESPASRRESGQPALVLVNGEAALIGTVSVRGASTPGPGKDSI